MSKTVVTSTLANDPNVLNMLMDRIHFEDSDTLIVGGGLFTFNIGEEEPIAITLTNFKTLLKFLGNLRKVVFLGTNNDFLFATALLYNTLGVNVNQSKVIKALKQPENEELLALVNKIHPSLKSAYVHTDVQIRTRSLFTTKGLDSKESFEETIRKKPHTFRHSEYVVDFVGTAIREGNTKDRLETIDKFDEIYVTAVAVQNYGMARPFSVGNVYLTDTGPSQSFKYPTQNIRVKGAHGVYDVENGLHISSREPQTTIQIDFDFYKNQIERSAAMRRRVTLSSVDDDYSGCGHGCPVPGVIKNTGFLPVIRRTETVKKQLTAYIE